MSNCSADIAQVESTFQIGNDNLEGSLPKIKIPRETFSPTHKIDSFSSWSAPLLPIPSRRSETHEDALRTHMNSGYGDLSVKANPLDVHEGINLECPVFQDEVLDEQNLVQSYAAVGQAPTNMTSCSRYVPCWSGYPGSEEQLVRWQLELWGAKDYQLDGSSTLINGAIL